MTNMFTRLLTLHNNYLGYKENQISSIEFKLKGGFDEDEVQDQTFKKY